MVGSAACGHHLSCGPGRAMVRRAAMNQSMTALLDQQPKSHTVVKRRKMPGGKGKEKKKELARFYSPGVQFHGSLQPSSTKDGLP